MFDVNPSRTNQLVYYLYEGEFSGGGERMDCHSEGGGGAVREDGEAAGEDGGEGS